MSNIISRYRYTRTCQSIIIILVLFFINCGNGNYSNGNCRHCRPWESCFSGYCDLRYSSKYSLFLEEGSVSQYNNWDHEIGEDALPDPYVCFKTSEKYLCSTVEYNNFHPKWREEVKLEFTAHDMIYGSMEIVMYDADVNTSEKICELQIRHEIYKNDFNGFILYKTYDCVNGLGDVYIRYKYIE